MDDRKILEVESPPRLPLAQATLWIQGKPDWKALKNHLLKEGRLRLEDCVEIVHRATAILTAEPTLLRLEDPIIVVGDIHGQFFDLVRLLSIGGDPGETQYLFLGDYVDRGSFSIEVMLLLLAFKINFPKRVWLLRGNHECRQMTSFFNFRDECDFKYNRSLYNEFVKCFDAIPLAAILNNKFLAVHGGISPSLLGSHNSLVEAIYALDRHQETPRAGLFCDLLWSDPANEDESTTASAMKFRESLPKNTSKCDSPRDSTSDVSDGAIANNSSSVGNGFYPNDTRGCSYFFTYQAAKKFLERNELLSIIRAHEAQLEGYKMHKTNKATHFPTVITIFSAPNYCDCYNNKGAILKFDKNTLNIQQFNFSPHPYYLPNFMDVFTWSLPFVTEKVTEILYAIIHPTLQCPDDDDLDQIQLPQEVMDLLHKTATPNEQEEGSATASSTPPTTPSPATGRPVFTKERAEALRHKVVAIGRLCNMVKTLREQHELILQLKTMSLDSRIPAGALLEELQKFANAKILDAVNERMPPNT